MVLQYKTGPCRGAILVGLQIGREIRCLEILEQGRENRVGLAVQPLPVGIVMPLHFGPDIPLRPVALAAEPFQ